MHDIGGQAGFDVGLHRQYWNPKRRFGASPAAGDRACQRHVLEQVARTSRARMFRGRFAKPAVGISALEQQPAQVHIPVMDKNRPPELEMTLDGEFVSPPAPPVSTRILFWAVVIAVIAGASSLAAIALTLALSILPVALGAAAVAYILYRYKLWRAGVSVGGQQDLRRQ
jgi:hypothetical protein